MEVEVTDVPRMCLFSFVWALFFSGLGLGVIVCVHLLVVWKLLLFVVIVVPHLSGEGC